MSAAFTRRYHVEVVEHNVGFVEIEATSPEKAYEEAAFLSEQGELIALCRWRPNGCTVELGHVEVLP